MRELCQLRLSQSEMPVAPVAAAPVLTATMPEADASRQAEVAEVEKAEPSASRPESEKESEKKHGVDETPEEFDSEAVRAAKRARQEMTQAEVEEEGMSDHDVTMKCLRLVQSSLEYTARQAAALKAVQEQLGETASLAYHSESCQRYALAAINQSAGHIKGMAWQLTGSRHEEKVSCKSLLQQLVNNTGKMGSSLAKLAEKQGTQNAERDKQFSKVLLAIQGRIADSYGRGTVPTATPITPNTGAASLGAGSAFPPTAPVMPGYAASVTGGSPGDWWIWRATGHVSSCFGVVWCSSTTTTNEPCSCSGKESNYASVEAS
eukprot:s1890_g22.t1